MLAGSSFVLSLPSLLFVLFVCLPLLVRQVYARVNIDWLSRQLHARFDQALPRFVWMFLALLARLS